MELVVKSALHVLESSFHETQILLHAAARNRTPLLLTSTSEVYGKSAKPEFSEDDDLLIGPPDQSRWSYASAKLTDEFLALACAREKNLPVIIARLFNTVGPRQTGRYGMVLPRFIAAAKRNEPLKVFGDGRQSRCFCFVNDVVEALCGCEAWLRRPRRKTEWRRGVAATFRRNFQHRRHGGDFNSGTREARG